MVKGVLGVSLYIDTPVWRVYKENSGHVHPVLVAWHTQKRDESRFLTKKTFGTKKEALAWVEEFWYAYWRFVGL
jgi:hypothetical protein